MGHDIMGLIKRDDDDEVAYLRRNMWSDSIHVFYNILGAGDLDAGVSGNGDEKKFTKEEIEEAIEKVKIAIDIDEDDKKDYIKFLTDFIENGGKWIHFG